MGHLQEGGWGTCCRASTNQRQRQHSRRRRRRSSSPCAAPSKLHATISVVSAARILARRAAACEQAEVVAPAVPALRRHRQPDSTR